jgi:hypothetical protein
VGGQDIVLGCEILAKNTADGQGRISKSVLWMRSLKFACRTNNLSEKLKLVQIGLGRQDPQNTYNIKGRSNDTKQENPLENTA